MSRQTLLAALVALGSLGISSASAAPPERITFQGRLTDADGQPVTDTVNLTFTLYQGSTAVWSETQGVAVTGGAYSVQLGSGTSFGTLTFDDAYSLGISVEGDSEMSPRLALGASPYALRAKSAVTSDTVTNGLYTTGNYADPSWLTSLSGSKIGGNIAGNAANVTGVVAIANGGTGSSTKSFVDLSLDQTVGGIKTFSSTIVGSISGNAGTVTNGVYTTGSYADPSWLTSLAGSKISGNISGNAANVTGVVALANGGTGSATKNFVDLSTDQTVAGVKTFSSTISGSINGNAATVTNGVYTGTSNTFTRGGQLIRTGNASNVGLTIQGYTGQTANLMEFKNIGGTVIASVDKDGNFNQTGSITASLDNMMALGSPVLRWADGYFGPGSIHVVANNADTGGGGWRDWAIGTQVKGDPVRDPVPGTFRLIERVSGNDVLDVTADGRVGIGTPEPAPKGDGRLDVRGNIKLGDAGEYFAVGATENLRTLRGIVDGKEGIIVAGKGFKVTKIQLGEYAVEFDRPFAEIPSVTVSAYPGGRTRQVTIVDIKREAFALITYVNGEQNDVGFSFVASGPQ